MVGETTWFSQLDVQLFLLLVGGLVTPFLMESSAHLKKKVEAYKFYSGEKIKCHDGPHNEK